VVLVIPLLSQHNNLLAPFVLPAGFSDSFLGGIPKAPPFVSGFAAQASTAFITLSSVSYGPTGRQYNICPVHELVTVLVSLSHRSQHRTTAASRHRWCGLSRHWWWGSRHWWWGSRHW
jgi:hypothetical protein